MIEVLATVILTVTAWGTPECPDGYRHVMPYCVAPVVDIGTPLVVEAWSGSGVERWRAWVEVYFKPWDVERAMRIIACESRGDPWAENPSSGAAGLFQHMPRYWEDRSSRYGWGGHSIWEVDANVAVAAALVYYDRMSWNHWVCQG